MYKGNISNKSLYSIPVVSFAAEIAISFLKANKLLEGVFIMKKAQYWLNVIVRTNGDDNYEYLADCLDNMKSAKLPVACLYYEGIGFAENPVDYPISSNGYDHAVEIEGDFFEDGVVDVLEWLGLKGTEINHVFFKINHSRYKEIFWDFEIDDLAFDLTVQKIDEVEIDEDNEDNEDDEF